MTSIAELMTHDHRSCDHDFARAETLVNKKDWEGATEAFEAFAEGVEAHFRAEEEELFPRFEAATGMTQGPTRVMRMEHAQIRQLQDQLIEAARAGKADAFQSVAETLLIMMEQHNMKEENILYPMAYNTAGASADELGARIAARREA